MKKVVSFGLLIILSIVSYGFSSTYFKNYFSKTNNNAFSEKHSKQVNSTSFSDFFAPPTNDDCANAIVVPVNTDAQCTLTTTGNFLEATLTPGFDVGCNEWQTIDKDVWYKFTATATSHAISFTEDTNTWSVNLQLFAIGACATPTDALYCGEYIVANNLVVGNEYLVRVFKEDSWMPTESDFHLCVRTLSSPDNDECADATVAPVNPGDACDLTVPGTFQDATLSNGFTTSCSEWDTPYKDVWFEFTATNTVHAITITDYDSWNLNMEVYEDTDNNCALTAPMICIDDDYLILGELQPGTLYKIRVFSTMPDDQEDFTLCVSTPTPPENDNCATPTVAPVNDGEECLVTIDGTMNGSSLSSGYSTGCDTWSQPQKDVWFKFTATNETHGITLTNYSGDFEWNAGIEVYNAAPCDALGAPLVCINDVMTQANDLTLGNEYLIRVFSASMTSDSDFTLCINSLTPPIYVSTTEYTVEELVNDVLVGNPCLVSNISWSTGVSHDPSNGNGIAYFNRNGSAFTLDDGILLTTGSASNVVGPATGPVNSGGAWPGDQDLFDYMTAQGLDVDDYNDASILEFDFVPTKADFSFDFVFGSNEYGQYQCEYSDAFAFFLTDMVTNTTTNLAVVPNSGAPISVTTIRKEIHSPDWGSGPLCPDSNPEFFDKCYDPDYNGLDPMIAPVNLRGHTVPMTAQATVVPGRTYHIKMVIADRNDNSFDSSVFLLGGSFDIGSIDFGDGLTFENDKALCYGDTYVLETGLGDEFTFEWFKDGVVIPGATSSSYTVTESGTYKVIATFGDTECGLEESVTIEFYPNLDDVINDPDDIIICDVATTVDLTVRENEMLEGTTGVFNFEYYLSADDLENGTNVINNPESYPFDGQVTIFVKVVTPGENSCHAVKELLVDVLPVQDPAVINNLIICNGYKLPQLPAGQRYFTGPGATGNELQQGELLKEGNYTIYVYSANGECYEENEFRLIVENCIIPKGISPNFDGYNDSFDLTKYYPTSVKIYNRYGKMVFEYGKGYTNQWIGQDNSGKLLPTGTYFYNFTTETGEYSGYVYIEREVK